MRKKSAAAFSHRSAATVRHECDSSLRSLRPCLGQGASWRAEGWAGKKVAFLRILQVILKPIWP
ncbi:MAG: hypothetical protein K0S45_2001 [Nitrospira sp.]|jgi:hypothetical protein|nr:hypothetical protein [Nitrospira sp.]